MSPLGFLLSQKKQPTRRAKTGRENQIKAERVGKNCLRIAHEGSVEMSVEDLLILPKSTGGEKTNCEKAFSKGGQKTDGFSKRTPDKRSAL